MGRKRFNCGQLDNRVSCSPRQKVAAGGINALGKVHTAVLLNCFLAHFGEEERDGRTRIILWRRRLGLPRRGASKEGADISTLDLVVLLGRRVVVRPRSTREIRFLLIVYTS